MLHTLRAGAVLGRRLTARLDPGVSVLGVADLLPGGEVKGLAEFTGIGGGTSVSIQFAAGSDKSVLTPYKPGMSFYEERHAVEKDQCGNLQVIFRSWHPVSEY